MTLWVLSPRIFRSHGINSDLYLPWRRVSVYFTILVSSNDRNASIFYVSRIKLAQKGSLACPGCSNDIVIQDLSPGFNGLGKEKCKTRWETFTFWDLVWLILEIRRYLKFMYTTFFIVMSKAILHYKKNILHVASVFKTQSYSLNLKLSSCKELTQCGRCTKWPFSWQHLQVHFWDWK